MYNQMVVHSRSATSSLSDDLTDDDVDRLFRALADATRRDIVRRTLLGEASVSVLAADYDMSFAAVQKHVAVLEQAGLVTKEQRGRERIVRGNPEQIARARALLTRLEDLWRARFDQLDAVLADSADPATPTPSTGQPIRPPSDGSADHNETQTPTE
jgi:DNA-binding transcriptional ArsR family regulator